MVTHDMQLPALATRVVVMSDGKVKDIINNNEEQRFMALQRLNNGIEDLTVFESQSSSVDSRSHHATTDIRRPGEYDRVHVLESTEDRFGYRQLLLERHHERSAELILYVVSLKRV